MNTVIWTGRVSTELSYGAVHLHLKTFTDRWVQLWQAGTKIQYQMNIFTSSDTFSILPIWVNQKRIYKWSNNKVTQIDHTIYNQTRKRGDSNPEIERENRGLVWTIVTATCMFRNHQQYVQCNQLSQNPHWHHQIDGGECHIITSNILRFCHSTGSNWKTKVWCWCYKDKGFEESKEGNTKQKSKLNLFSSEY